jgi:hypothetical protein
MRRLGQGCFLARYRILCAFHGPATCYLFEHCEAFKWATAFKPTSHPRIARPAFPLHVRKRLPPARGCNNAAILQPGVGTVGEQGSDRGTGQSWPASVSSQPARDVAEKADWKRKRLDEQMDREDHNLRAAPWFYWHFYGEASDKAMGDLLRIMNVCRIVGESRL